MGNIKSLLSLLVGFIMAFLLGIAGWKAIFHILIAIPGVGPSGIEKYGYSPWGDMTGFFVAMLTGLPLGSSLGIFITKRFLFRTGKFSVLCLFTSLVFGVLAAHFLWPNIPDYIIDLVGPSLTDISVFLLVPLFALIGYNAMEMLLRRRKESGRSAPQKHLNDRDSSPVIEKQNQ
jgi:hypothetical protein